MSDAAPELTASCHCGRAVLRLARAPERITHCNCSLCQRTGFRGIYYSSDEVEVSGEFDAYIREDIGEPFLRNLRCRTCGIATHWEPLTEPPHQRIGVNARLLDPALLADVEIIEVDGASF